MLRTRLNQPVRFQRLKVSKGGSQRRQVELGFEGKVIRVGLHPQQFELHKGPDGAHQMVGLRHGRPCRRFGQRQAAFERLVIFLDLPPCLVQRRNLPKAKRRIARHQIQDARAAISVCEDLFGQHQRKVYAFQPHFPHSTRFQFQRCDCLIAALLLLVPTQRHLWLERLSVIRKDQQPGWSGPAPSTTADTLQCSGRVPSG